MNGEIGKWTHSLIKIADADNLFCHFKITHTSNILT